MAREDQGAPDESWATSRVRRERALRDLANQSLGAAAERASAERASTGRSGAAERIPPTISPASQLQTRPARPLLVVGLVIAVAAVSLGGYVALRPKADSRASASATPPPAVVLRPVADQLWCQQDVSWSPDGKRLVVLGYVSSAGASETQCPFYTASNDGTSVQYIYYPGELAIYSASNAGTPTTIDLDKLVDAALHLQAPSNIGPVPRAFSGSGLTGQIINYGKVLWSADGTQLVVTFVVPGATGLNPDGSFAIISRLAGVLRTNLAGTETHVVGSTVAADGTQSLGTWNLATGAYVPYPKAPSGSSFAQQGPPLALGYNWGASGAGVALQPGQTLAPGASPAAPPLAAIGNPTAASFSVWQPATISPIPYVDSPGGVSQTLPGAYVFSAKLFSMPPDGSYVTNTVLVGLLETGAPPDAALLRKANVDTLPVLPLRDQGLRAALAALSVANAQATQNAQNANQGQGLFIDAAWSPDGKRLATLLSAPSTDANGRTTVKASVTIYDCDSGKVLATLSPAASFVRLFAPADGFTWSPDGSHLLAYTGQLGEITVWDVRSVK